MNACLLQTSSIHACFSTVWMCNHHQIWSAAKMAVTFIVTKWLMVSYFSTYIQFINMFLLNVIKCLSLIFRVIEVAITALKKS
jgi:hypothetical protein